MAVRLPHLPPNADDDGTEACELTLLEASAEVAGGRDVTDVERAIDPLRRGVQLPVRRLEPRVEGVQPRACS